MKNLKLLFLLLFAATVLQSCTIAKISSRGSIPILYNQPTDDMEVTEHVKVEKFVSFDWFANEYDMNQLLSEAVADKKPDAIANVSIHIKTTIKSHLLNSVTCNIANARQVVIEADIMHYADPNNPKSRKKKGGKK